MADLRETLEDFTEAANRLHEAAGRVRSHLASTRTPFGYVHPKSGVDNGYYFLTPAEYAHVEERFQHLYKPVFT